MRFRLIPSDLGTRGLVEGLKAIVSAARNPAAHEPKILAYLDESDAIDLLTQMSYLHR
jgi:Protein of unknown function (Hypoth_ymh)